MNVVATGRAAEILAVSGGILLCPQVEGEVLYLEANDEAGVPEPIDLAPLIGAGILERVTMSTSEVDLFVTLAAEVDDGEAQVLAVALERQGLAVTDDRRAQRLATHHKIPVIGTPEILKEWTAALRMKADEVLVALDLVERRAHYRPRRDHALAAWWDDPKSS